MAGINGVETAFTLLTGRQANAVKANARCPAALILRSDGSLATSERHVIGALPAGVTVPSHGPFA